jgi:hypothetical protein
MLCRKLPCSAIACFIVHIVWYQRIECIHVYRVLSRPDPLMYHHLVNHRRRYTVVFAEIVIRVRSAVLAVRSGRVRRSQLSKHGG